MKAEKMNEESVAHVIETNKLITEIIQKTENISNEFRTQMMAELENLLLDIAKAKDNLENRNILQEISQAGKYEASGKNSDARLFKGWRELKIIPPYDTLQKKRLVEFLKQVPSIQLSGEAANDDYASIYIDIVEPLPLLALLGETLLVENLNARGDTIKMRLRAGGNGN